MFKWFKRLLNLLKRLFNLQNDKLELANKLSKPVKHRFKDKKPLTTEEEFTHQWFHMLGAAGGGGTHDQSFGQSGEDCGVGGSGAPGFPFISGYQPNQTRLDTSNPPGNPPKKL